MTTKTNHNIFTNNKPSQKTNGSSIFLNFTPSNENTFQKQNKSVIVTKRQNFCNEIRKKQKQQIKSNLRSQILRNIRNDDFFNQLQLMAKKNCVQSNNLSIFLSDLKNTVNDYEFCKRLQESETIKKYLLDLYFSSKQLSTIQQKCLLIQSLILLTYYGNSTFENDQKQKLTNQLINQIQKIKGWDFELIDYFRSLLDLLTNVTADKDKNFNYYLADTKIFYLIAEKITEIAEKAQKVALQAQDQKVQQYISQLTCIRRAFIGALWNLSECCNKFFFEFTVNQFVNDQNYIESFPINVVMILDNFFQHQQFRQDFFANPDLYSWFQNFIPQVCQKKFTNPQSKKTGIFQNTIFSENEKQLFYQFLTCLITFIDNQENGDYHLQTLTLVEENLNLYCLSEFIIQSASWEDKQNGVKRKDKYVAKAIRIYQHLAMNPNRSVSQLLTTISQRSFEDIIKIFLQKTYFTSFRISDITISFLNKVLSKDNQMLKTFMELRILESIENFLEGSMELQTNQQIINFLQLLILMVMAEEQNNRKQRGKNKIVQLLDMKGFIRQIERYQNHSSRQVSDKVEAFLSHFDVYRQGNFREQNVIDI